MKNPLKISSSSRVVAKNLLELGAIQLDPDFGFTWASGIKSPIYCDNRKINSNVEVRKIVVKAFVDLITKEFPDVEIIAGVATGGIPFGILIADKMDLPFIYVRQEPKGHGLMKQVEGSYQSGDKIVVIEDLISTGGSSFKAIQGLREQELNILSLVSVMTYGFKTAMELFEKEGVNQWSLCDLDTIVDVAFETNRIGLKDKEVLLEFKNSH